jgi:hypothetical protein
LLPPAFLTFEYLSSSFCPCSLGRKQHAQAPQTNGKANLSLPKVTGHIAHVTIARRDTVRGLTRRDALSRAPGPKSAGPFTPARKPDIRATQRRALQGKRDGSCCVCACLYICARSCSLLPQFPMPERCTVVCGDVPTAWMPSCACFHRAFQQLHERASCRASSCLPVAYPKVARAVLISCAVCTAVLHGCRIHTLHAHA